MLASRFLIVVLTLLIGATGYVVATESLGEDGSSPASAEQVLGPRRPRPTTTTTTATTSTTSTTRPPTTTTTTQPPSDLVDIWPDDDVNAMLASHPEGTAFLMHAGLYSNLTLMPRSSQSITGEPGTILDGGGVTEDGVGRAVANDVTIRGLKITNYTGACVNWGADGWGQRWTIEDVDAGYCEVGMVVKKGGTYRNNYIHHNSVYGMIGSGEWGLLIEGNEIAYNRTDATADIGDSGGTKFHNTVDMVLRDNHVHDNYGHGLWLDGSNTAALIEDNLVVSNDLIGIFHELGYSPVIRDNAVEDNGSASSGSGGDGAGILAFAVRDAEIYGNTVSGNRHGIAGKNDERGIDVKTGLEWKLEDLYVHDNDITMDQGVTGIWDYHADLPVLAGEANIRFEFNSYTLIPPTGLFFRWVDANPGTSTWDYFDLAGWQQYFPLDG